MATELRVSIRNTSDTGGTALTPFFTAFHDGQFDVYNLGEAASAGLEALAEDGNNSIIADEVLAVDADAQTTNVVGTRGPIGTRELAATTISVDGVSNGFVSVASMLLPSNDAFIGTGEAVQLFDSDGNFLGAQTLTFDGGSVLDAGTEVNTERDAAFINQTAPNTGETEGGTVELHPGFNGSLGNPGGEQIILGGTNAFGDFIDPAAADFTQAGANIATVHVNVVQRHTGTDGKDIIKGGRADDFVDAGAGNDIILGGRGWDVLNGEDGRDLIKGGSGDDIVDGGAGNDFLFGGSGADDVYGGEGHDFIRGGSGNDNLSGGAGSDRVSGGSGNDVVTGGEGYDWLTGGQGADIFVFATGDGTDLIRDFGRGEDRLALNVEGVDTFADVLDAATENRFGVTLDFGDGDEVLLHRTEISDLNADDFLFA